MRRDGHGGYIMGEKNRPATVYPYLESVRSDVDVLASSIYGDLGGHIQYGA